MSPLKDYQEWGDLENPGPSSRNSLPSTLEDKCTSESLSLGTLRPWPTPEGADRGTETAPEGLVHPPVTTRGCRQGTASELSRDAKQMGTVIEPRCGSSSYMRDLTKSSH